MVEPDLQQLELGQLEVLRSLAREASAEQFCGLSVSALDFFPRGKPRVGSNGFTTLPGGRKRMYDNI